MGTGRGDGVPMDSDLDGNAHAIRRAQRMLVLDPPLGFKKGARHRTESARRVVGADCSSSPRFGDVTHAVGATPRCFPSPGWERQTAGVIQPDPAPWTVLLRHLSMDPRLEGLAWRRPGAPTRAYRSGRRVWECEERRRSSPLEALRAGPAAGAGPGRTRSFAAGEGATLRVDARAPEFWTAGELAGFEALGLELAPRPRSGRAPGAAESEVATRLHDLAHFLAHAQLLLAAEGALDRARLRAGLDECARSLAAAEHTEAPPETAGATRIAELIERETRHALGARRGSGSVRVLARIDRELQTRLDPHTLGRLVRNLLLNAIEASAEGGVVRVRAWRSESELRLEVRDEGRGLDERKRTRLFGPHGIEARGTGVGNESVRLCALRLGARIAVEGAPGRGLAVTVSWEAESSGASVALLADVPAARERIAARLRREGARVLDQERSMSLLRAGLVKDVARWVVARGSPTLATEAGRSLYGRAFEVTGLA